ncbi:hypothetical protein VSU16_05755 [Cetobacterium somerae]|uniref:hypothetical protein n=1 Tax=Cetobacterium somerae TaxID=188913 RepID=UPI002E7C41D7|nr:hypothetical protein [Cetobacterium somerae]WVJ00331.1 hypothetical protein VSU16_05755 [Cetobacterium somerae]
MKNKMLVFTSSILIFLIILFWGKNIYFKNIITKQLSTSFKQEVTIKKANFSFFNNSFELKNLSLIEYNISIENVECKMDFKTFFKSKNNFTISNLTLNGISFNNNLISSPLTNTNNSNEKTTEFLKEIDDKIQFDKNLSKFFSSSFNKDNFSKTLSNNLINFLIQNTDYIDVIIQKEINIQFKEQINNFSKKTKDLLLKIKNHNNLEKNTNIFIENISFSGKISKIDFNGSFKDFNTNLSKNISLPLNIFLSHENGSGKVYGDINTNTLVGNIYVSLSNFNVHSFYKVNNYISNGTLSSEQLISISGETLKIDGTTIIDNIKLNKDFILNSHKLDDIKKNILEELIKLTENNYHTLSITNHFSNNTDIVTIKTSIPNEVKRTLINNRELFSVFLENQLKNKYENNLKEKKNRIKNFFKNIF